MSDFTKKEILNYLEEYRWKAKEYAEDVVSGREKAGKYVKKECKKFLWRFEHQNTEEFNYRFDTTMIDKVNRCLLLLNFATGFRAGQPMLFGMFRFQFFILHNIFCWLENGTNYRLIKKVYLELARKSGKTFLVALIMIIGMIISDDFSQLFSGGKTRETATLIFDQMTEILVSSPKIDKLFKRTKTYFECLRTHSTFRTISSEANNANGKRPQIYVLDEVATLTDFSLWDAMKYGQMSVRSPLAISISTAYTVPNNIFKQQCEHLKQMLDGLKEDDNESFGMLFELDEEDLVDWGNIDNWIKASPMQMTFPEGKKMLLAEYSEAIAIGGSKIGEFQSKMLNMWVDDTGVSLFVPYDVLKKCRLSDTFDWKNREVYIGIDASKSDDNMGVAFLTKDKQLDKYVGKYMTFIPKDRINEKTKLEKVPYQKYIDQKYCIACDDREDINNTNSIPQLMSYIHKTVVENNLKVKAIISDYFRYDIIDREAYRYGYKVIAQKQRAIDLGNGTQMFRDCILNQTFAYEFNPLFELNVRGCKKDELNDNMVINKKKSTWKIDLADATVNCFCLFYNDEVKRNSIYNSPKRKGFIVI